MGNSLLLALFLLAVFVPTNANKNPYCQANFNQNPAAVDKMKKFGKLEMVQALIRHGDRAPCNTLKTPDRVEWACDALPMSAIKNKNRTVSDIDRVYRKVYMKGFDILPGTCGLGELTEKGRQQHKALGSYWRKIYIDTYGLLPTTFDASKIFIRSTDVFRTVQSAESNLDGLYPDPPDSPGVIDIHVSDRGTDYLTPSSRRCPRLRNLVDDIYRTKMMDRHYQTVIPLVDRLHRVMKVKSNRHLSVGATFDHMNARDCHGLKWPEGFDRKDLEAVTKETTWHTQQTLSTPELNRLSLGKLVTEWVRHFEHKIAGRKVPLWYLYSGHDSSVFPALTALRIFDGQWPPYASHILLELWSTPCSEDGCEGKDYFVRVIYNGKEMTLPGCSKGEPCPFADFKESLKDVITDHPERECFQIDNKARRRFRRLYRKRDIPIANSYHSFIHSFMADGPDFS